jgi:hypothetical protein
MQEQQNQLIRNGDRTNWRQLVRNKAGAKLNERTITLNGDIHHTVDEFAEFCVASGGDRFVSVGTAMNEIQAQSKELLEKLYLAEHEEDVEVYGSMLDCAIPLFKALESYYVHHFGLRTGTSGD